MKIPKVAVVGGGYWGKNLVRNFNELGALAVICDSNRARLEEYKSLYPGIGVIEDYNELLTNKDIDGVAIATPAIMHYEMTKQALNAGKDVLVEKPLALMIDQGEELAALADKKKRILMIGHILEYHPAVVKLAELVRNGTLGKIQYIYSNRLNLGKFRTEENILWSFAPHDISVILRLLGELPEQITASGGNYINNQIADVTVTNMSFKNGVRAHIFVSWLHPFKEQKLVVVGSDKMAVFNDMVEDKLLVYHHKVNWVDHCPVAAKGEAESVAIDSKEPLKQECQHFLDRILDRRTPVTGSKNALDVLKVLSASQQSLENNGKPVILNKIAYCSEPVKLENKLPGVYIHPSSVIDRGVSIGEGTKVWHFSHVMPDASIGSKCNIGQNVFIGKGVKIGNNVKIQNNVSVYEGVTLENDVFCGPSCVFTNIKTPRSAYPRNKPGDYTETVVKKGATIGANATVVCGINIGENALIGAGAVVTRDVPDHAVVYGNPAEIKGWACRCGNVIKAKKEDIKCDRCKFNF